MASGVGSGVRLGVGSGVGSGSGLACDVARFVWSDVCLDVGSGSSRCCSLCDVGADVALEVAVESVLVVPSDCGVSSAISTTSGSVGRWDSPAGLSPPPQLEMPRKRVTTAAVRRNLPEMKTPLPWKIDVFHYVMVVEAECVWWSAVDSLRRHFFSQNPSLSAARQIRNIPQEYLQFVL